ncbi:peptidoglycan recognition protein family protein [Listeria rustica]|uniref:N-acetylmuramoyl-L-alanine amidase n=1 Tax=Listeria rustica TaxID=2713503 RepID=A0A7W1YF53_9LIST|nr:peptidoglycan recognition family protein [Listeria rustica]MBA3925261.1 N-acetylmuramoyl-L-alanine amidase [Listeria rustica]
MKRLLGSAMVGILVLGLVFTVGQVKTKAEQRDEIVPPEVTPTIEVRHVFEDIPDFPHIPYRNGIGMPEGVVLHSTGDTSRTLEEWIQYEQDTWNNAFVHAFADENSVVEIADTDYIAWGAGSVANQRFIHIELVEYPEGTEREVVLKSIEQYANYVATMLHKYNLGLPDFMDEDGEGNVITHQGVTTWLGGTTHTDPYNYLPNWDISMDYVIDRINYYYNLNS